MLDGSSRATDSPSPHPHVVARLLRALFVRPTVISRPEMSNSNPSESRWRNLFILMMVALTAWRFIYLAWLTPLDLAQDEAHYWDWSRNLDWSYYSKGPLVAWLIRLSLELFGPLSIALTGNEALALRIPAVCCGSLILVALYILTKQTLHSDRLAFYATAISAILPLSTAVSLLMTIDSPFICLWSWALVAGHRAVSRNETWAWALTGAFIALGILAKYTMALWLFSFGLFLLFTPTHRQILFSRGFWIMTAVASLSALPIVIWNATHGWVTFRHVAGQAGVSSTSSGIRWFGLADFLIGQFFLLIGWWFIIWAQAIVRFNPRKVSDSSIRYLWWMSAPTIAVFSISSMRSSGQLNWPAAAYVSGGVLMVAQIFQWGKLNPVPWSRWLKINLALAVLVSLTLSIIVHDTALIRPATAAVARQAFGSDPFAVRKLDPTCRLRGWNELGHEIDAVRRDILKAEGDEPILASTYWNMPGEIGFYCSGHPKVYSLGPLLAERFNQYDLWRPNPIADPEHFLGRTFVVVNGEHRFLAPVFAEVTCVKEFIYREGESPIAVWTIWVCRGYRGPADVELPHRGRY